MKLAWSHEALEDLTRLFNFLHAIDPHAAARTVQSLSSAPLKFLEQPRLGERLDEFTPKEVRRILVGRYDMRYELQREHVYILRIWHTRGKR